MNNDKKLILQDFIPEFPMSIVNNQALYIIDYEVNSSHIKKQKSECKHKNLFKNQLSLLLEDISNFNPNQFNKKYDEAYETDNTQILDLIKNDENTHKLKIRLENIYNYMQINLYNKQNILFELCKNQYENFFQVIEKEKIDDDDVKNIFYDRRYDNYSHNLINCISKFDDTFNDLEYLNSIIRFYSNNNKKCISKCDYLYSYAFYHDKISFKAKTCIENCLYEYYNHISSKIDYNLSWYEHLFSKKKDII